MPRDFFDPPPENRSFYYAATLHKAERLIDSCEYCNPDSLELFKMLLRQYWEGLW